MPSTLIARRLWSKNALRRLRLATTFDGHKNATQLQMARAIHVGHYRYYCLENDIEQPTSREAEALAKVFGCSVEDLGVTTKESKHVRIRLRPDTDEQSPDPTP